MGRRSNHPSDLPSVCYPVRSSRSVDEAAAFRPGVLIPTYRFHNWFTTRFIDPLRQPHPYLLVVQVIRTPRNVSSFLPPRPLASTQPTEEDIIRDIQPVIAHDSPIHPITPTGRQVRRRGTDRAAAAPPSFPKCLTIEADSRGWHRPVEELNQPVNRQSIVGSLFKRLE